MTAPPLAPNALQARVQKLLSSRTEVESTKALLHTLVGGDGRSPPEDHTARGTATGTRTTIVTLDPTSSLAELRKGLRQTLEDKQLDLAEAALRSLAETLGRVKALKGHVDALDAKCVGIQGFLETTKRETEQVQTEATALAAKKEHVQRELAEIKAFLAKYQLLDDEVQGLYTKSLGDDEMHAFFPVMERAQQVKADCRSLVASGDVACALELLDAVGKYQEAGFERLYQWTTKKCTEIDGEPSTELHRAIALLRDRPEYYNYCKESLTSTRRSLIVRRFISALTRGGPNGIPRPIEMYAHDPVRYCGDMLAWVHQAIATENEFFRVLFDGDMEFTAIPRLNVEGSTDISSGEDELCTSIVGRAFEGVARPLQVRVEQTLGAQHGIVIAYKLVHLIAFYHHKFSTLVTNSGVARALASCREAANRAFKQQFHVLVEGMAASAQDYSANLAATHAIMDVSHRLVALLEVYQTSLISEHEAESDLSPLFDTLLPAVHEMCGRTVQTLDPVDARVFEINNLSCIQVSLTRFPHAKVWFESIGREIDEQLHHVSMLQAKRLLDRHNVSSILHKIEAFKASSIPKAAVLSSQWPGLDGETISSVMEDFCKALMSLIFPQFDHITQPDLREKARNLTVVRLADIYTAIYDFVHVTDSGYHTSHSAASALGGSNVILLHTPHEIRTVLEID